MKNLTKLQNRRSCFPVGWENTQFSKNTNHNTLVKRCVELYIDSRVFTLDQIAEQVGLPDRRHVGSYLSRAKKAVLDK